MDFDTTDWIVAVLVAAVIIAVIWYKFGKELKFLMRKTEVNGRITNWMAAMQNGKRVYYPMIEFESKERGRITFRAEELCEGQPIYPPGTNVRIYYLPGDPEIRKVVYPQRQNERMN